MGPDEKIILHLDMDSFYASVEIRDNPDIAGMPVVIGADPKNGSGRGVVSTCSYEARRFGIHSGMPISRAFQLCPDAVFLPPVMKKYVRVSERIMQLLRDIAGEIEQVSIDEAYLDLTSDQNYDLAAEHAAEIKQYIAEQEHLTCSVGVAPSRTYAKIASEQQKPDGLFVVRPEELIGFLYPLPAGSIPGIGKKSVHVLTEAGIHTIGDLSKTDIQILQDIFGSNAVRVHQVACGLDRQGLSSRGQRRSISRDHTFPEDTADSNLILAHIRQMVTSIGHELEERRMFSKTIGIRIRYKGFVTRTKSVTLIQPTRREDVITRAASGLLYEMWTGEPVRLVGVRCSGLHAQDPVQKTLQDFYPSDGIS